MKLTDKPNRLINESSPYLLQHAYNPVDWYPWGEEAFDKAKKENKPIFLSIGYSTCHWCHVMERESFKDVEVASLLNSNFVPIKVDREQRPDIDHIYMSACIATNKQGGWPLTVLLTPEQKPFFAGTYFPKETSLGRPGLIKILSVINEEWRKNRGNLLVAAEKLTSSINENAKVTGKEKLGEAIFKDTTEYFQKSFDSKNGGFGPPPKFPSPHNLIYLTRYSKTANDKKTFAMVSKTLISMAKGGIFDQVGFGFSRYSTDSKWLIPHFEKMLYDNALLAIAYLEAFQAGGSPLFARIADEVFTYILRDMTSDQGVFYTAEDADSEGAEGLFYLWRPEEIKQNLDSGRGEDFCRTFNITETGNFAGANIPNLILHEDNSLLELKDKYAEFVGVLSRVREKREHPFKDKKIIPAWNGLMIAASAIGGRVLHKKKYIRAAIKAAEYFNTEQLNFLDDYAFITWGMLELYRSTLKTVYLLTALEITKEMIKMFWDSNQNAFCMAPINRENLIAKPVEFYDGAVPSGNSAAAMNLTCLSIITGNKSLEEKRKQLQVSFTAHANNYPAGYCFFLLSLLKSRYSREIVIAGRQDSRDTKALITAVNDLYIPHSTLLLANPDDSKLKAVIPEFNEYEMVNGKATAYVCQNFSCREPIVSAEKLTAVLKETS